MKLKDQRKRPSRHFKRKVHFGPDEIWSYRIGQMMVKIRTPKGTTTTTVLLSTLTGMSEEDLERGLWKKTWRGVGPQEIKNYIAKYIRE